jgi:hypothetical protein
MDLEKLQNLDARLKWTQQEVERRIQELGAIFIIDQKARRNFLAAPSKIWIDPIEAMNRVEAYATKNNWQHTMEAIARDPSQFGRILGSRPSWVPFQKDINTAVATEEAKSFGKYRSEAEATALKAYNAYRNLALNYEESKRAQVEYEKLHNELMKELKQQLTPAQAKVLEHRFAIEKKEQGVEQDNGIEDDGHDISY